MKNPEELLKSLNSEQKQAVLSLRGPMLITAGAGTGKTTTIAHRIAYGIATGAYNPAKILALSYTARAAAELRDRLHNIGITEVTVRTFHSAALAQLQYFWPIHTGAKLPTLEQNKSTLISEATKQLGLKLNDRQLRELISEVEWRKYRLLSLDDYRAMSSRSKIEGLSAELVFAIIEAYEQVKVTRSVIDWEDVLLLTLGLLQAEPAALSHIHAQFRQFFVDEFQDISPLQWELLRTWMGKSTDLCAVGDPRQAIFGFAGADISIMREMEYHFRDLQSVELIANYRSRREILDLARRVDPESLLEPARGNSVLRGEQKFVRFPSAAAEASWTAVRILGLLAEGLPSSEIAVLSRVTANLEAIQLELINSGVPVTIRGLAYFQQPMVVKALAMIRALQVSDSGDPVFIQVERILRQLGWHSDPPAKFDEDWERLDWMSKRLSSLGPDATAAEFVADLDDLQRGQYEPKLPAVTLSTIHAAKGLEWRAVFLNQLGEGTLPYFRSIVEPERIAEERRLLYVAITRARTHFFGTYSSTDTSGRKVSVSRFLEGVDFESVK